MRTYHASNRIDDINDAPVESSLDSAERVRIDEMRRHSRDSSPLTESATNDAHRHDIVRRSTIGTEEFRQ